MDDILLSVFLFVLGAGVGSFISAFVSRTQLKQSIWRESSRCDSCKHQLNGAELTPIFGWIFCRGRCRHCSAKIGVEPLTTELVAAILFVVSHVFWPSTFDGGTGLALFGLWLIILSGLICLALFDIKTTKLPNKIIYPLMIVAAIFWTINTIAAGQIANPEHWSGLVLAMLPITGLYGLVYLITSGKAIGLGDVKLGIIIALLLPWQGTVAVLVLANLIALIFYPFIAKKHQIPFGPFLIIATIVVFYIVPLISWPV